MAEQKSYRKVSLYLGTRPVARCVLRYLGMLGMVIDPGMNKYARNTQLEVELVRKTIDGLRRIRLPVVVTRSSSAGLMLMYRGHVAYECAELKAMILETADGSVVA